VACGGCRLDDGKRCRPGGQHFSIHTPSAAVKSYWGNQAKPS
jgi:hypothetical protein